MTKNNEELVLGPEQIKKLRNILEETNEKVSIVGRVFQWIDDNILSKTTRLWMYVLEIMGIISIIVVLLKFTQGLNMITNAQNDVDFHRAELYLSYVRDCIAPIATMVATICAALPTVMGVFRALKKKWNGNTLPLQYPEIGPTPNN